MEEEKIIFCKSGGCTAKLGAGVLEHILEKLPKGEKDPNLLVGYFWAACRVAVSTMLN